MELSRQKQTEAKKLNVTVQYLVIADLIAIGYSEGDAYSIAFPENESLAEQHNSSIRKSIFESVKFRKLLEGRKSRVKDGIATPVSLSDVKLIDTDEVLKEVLRSARQQPVGSKERADLYAKYNDIKNESEQGTDDTTDAIEFYFPMKCSQCPLLHSYNEEMKRNTDEDGNVIRPVEMERVIRLSRKIIQASSDSAE